MSVQKDWMHDAAIAIRSLFIDDPFVAHDVDVPLDDQVRDVIVEHCPFKPDVTYMEVEPDVAYMPVPRCDQCKHWTETSDGRVQSDDPHICELLTDAIYTNDDPSGVWLETAPDFGCVKWEAKP